MARFSSGGVAIHYVLPVLWMTSRLAVMGATPIGGMVHRAATVINDVAILGRSLMSMNACFRFTLPSLQHRDNKSEMNTWYLAYRATLVQC